MTWVKWVLKGTQASTMDGPVFLASLARLDLPVTLGMAVGTGVRPLMDLRV